MLRFLSKRFGRKGGVNRHQNQATAHQSVINKNGTATTTVNGKEIPTNLKHHICCKILLLDGTDVTIFLAKKALGGDLYDEVCKKINLTTESDYFGLQFTDTTTQSHWLDYTKEIRKQVKIGPPFTFRMKVKFYSSDPNNLKDEFTRYLFFLQV